MTVIMFDYNYSDKYKREHKFEFYDGIGVESPTLQDPLINEYEKNILKRILERNYTNITTRLTSMKTKTKTKRGCPAIYGYR